MSWVFCIFRLFSFAYLPILPIHLGGGLCDIPIGERPHVSGFHEETLNPGGVDGSAIVHGALYGNPMSREVLGSD